MKKRSLILVILCLVVFFCVFGDLNNSPLVKTDIQNNNPDIQITAGLTGSVEIKTGTRSVMEYFLEPVIDGFGNSMKEK